MSGVEVDQEADAAVVIDEAILMAKQYDSQETTPFINGLLDDVRRMNNSGGTAAGSDRRCCARQARASSVEAGPDQPSQPKAAKPKARKKSA